MWKLKSHEKLYFFSSKYGEMKNVNIVTKMQVD